MLSRQIDALLVVSRVEAIPRPALQQLRRVLDTTSAPTLGLDRDWIADGRKLWLWPVRLQAAGAGSQTAARLSRRAPVGRRGRHCDLRELGVLRR